MKVLIGCMYIASSIHIAVTSEHGIQSSSIYIHKSFTRALLSIHHFSLR